MNQSHIVHQYLQELSPSGEVAQKRRAFWKFVVRAVNVFAVLVLLYVMGVNGYFLFYVKASSTESAILRCYNLVFCLIAVLRELEIPVAVRYFRALGWPFAKLVFYTLIGFLSIQQQATTATGLDFWLQWCALGAIDTVAFLFIFIGVCCAHQVRDTLTEADEEAMASGYGATAEGGSGSIPSVDSVGGKMAWTGEPGDEEASADRASDKHGEPSWMQGQQTHAPLPTHQATDGMYSTQGGQSLASMGVFGPKTVKHDTDPHSNVPSWLENQTVATQMHQSQNNNYAGGNHVVNYDGDYVGAQGQSIASMGIFGPNPTHHQSSPTGNSNSSKDDNSNPSWL